MASVGNAKALIGTIFLQYCSYAVFYIFDEITGIAPSMYRPLIKEQEEEIEVPAGLKAKMEQYADKKKEGAQQNQARERDAKKDKDRKNANKNRENVKNMKEEP